MASPASRTSARPRVGARDVLALVGFAVAVAAVAGLGSIASTQGVEGWYADAERPSFSPPDAVFAPVWTALYALMAVAAWLLWRRSHDLPRVQQQQRAGRALVLWWVQLAVNLAWAPVFFGLELLWAGLVVIALLDVLVVVTIAVAWRPSRAAALLLVPYLAWIAYATALNAGVAALNA